MRPAAICVMLASAVTARAAVAQVCHGPAAAAPPPAPTADPRVDAHRVGDPDGRRGVWLELRGEGAAIAAADAHWQGLTIAVGWRTARLAMRAALPTYHLDDGDGDHLGFGDAGVEAHVAVLRTARLTAGAGLALTAPTGDADAGLGMGHAMAAPSLWSSGRVGRVSAVATASLAHALGGDEHHHHHAPPRVQVNPMSPVELGATLRVGYLATRRWTPFASGAIAVPLSDGAADRGFAGAGVAWQLARDWRLHAEAIVPVAGDDEAARATIGISRWL